MEGPSCLGQLAGLPHSSYTCMSKLCALHSIFIWGMKRNGYCNLECMAVGLRSHRTNECSYIKTVSLDYSANPCGSSLLILRKDGDDRIIYLFIYNLKKSGLRYLMLSIKKFFFKLSLLLFISSTPIFERKLKIFEMEC